MQAPYFLAMAEGTTRLQQTAAQSLQTNEIQTGHSQQIHSSMGEVMPLLAAFMECLPAEFIRSQSTSLLDHASRMPEEAFERVKVTP